MALAAFLCTFTWSLVTISSSDYSKTCNPMDYGAHGDGKNDDTKAIQAAMDDCFLKGKEGKVQFPKGKSFLSFALNITDVSNVGFEIESGSTLLISDDRDSWPGEQNFINIDNADNIAIFGDGLINGQGQKWWNYPRNFRPRTIQTNKVNGLLIEDLTIIDPPGHCLEIFADNVEISHVTVQAPITSDNTDAVDVHGSPFWIHDCYFNNGDDNVAVHSSNLLVENCRFGTGHGASIGGGNLKNITFDNIDFNGTTNGIRIKTSNSSNSAGTVQDIWYTNLRMTHVKNSIIITQFYNNTHNDDAIVSSCQIDGVHIENVTSTKSTNAGQFMCQKETPCKNIKLKNVNIETVNGKPAFECQEAYGEAENTSPKSCLMSE